MSCEFAAVGLRIAELRGTLAQAEFAERLNVDRKTVGRWEAGERLPDGSSLLKLMTEFGADVNYILTGLRAGSVQPAPAAISGPDRILLANFHAAPEQVQVGVRTALGAFAASTDQVKPRKRAA